MDPKNLEFIVIIIPPIQKMKNKMMKMFPFPVDFESRDDVPVLEVFEFVLGVNDIVLKIRNYLITRLISGRIIKDPINPNCGSLCFCSH